MAQSYSFAHIRTFRDDSEANNNVDDEDFVDSMKYGGTLIYKPGTVYIPQPKPCTANV